MLHGKVFCFYCIVGGLLDVLVSTTTFFSLLFQKAVIYIYFFLFNDTLPEIGVVFGLTFVHKNLPLILLPF